VVKTVDTLDQLDEGELGDREVVSLHREIEPADEALKIDAHFELRASETRNTGVWPPRDKS
jgi:hypothetical protein